MATVVDTNLLLRMADSTHPHCPIAERAVGILRDRDEGLFAFTQNFIEFWSVATRPKSSQNGLGMSHPYSLCYRILHWFTTNGSGWF